MNNYYIVGMPFGEYTKLMVCLDPAKTVEDNIINAMDHGAEFFGKGKLLVDKLLIVGDTEDRFVCFDYDNGKVDFTSEVIVKNVPDYYRDQTILYLHYNYGKIEKSPLTDAQKQKIKNKITF